jgi:hypothetical protein
MMSKDIASPPVVLIYDDEQGTAAGIKDMLSAIEGADLKLLQDANLEVEILERRRRSARSDDEVNEPSVFDDADILIVDYDLTGTDERQGGPAETGERVAYLARCYSRCGTIVALNQYAVTATFDLSLVGHISSYADINISGDQIGNPALWGMPREGFAPWSWPDLTSAPSLQRRREALLADRLDEPALAVLGLDKPNVSNTLTRNQLAWLSPDRVPSQATVRQVIGSGRIGLRPSDVPWSQGGLERVAAARLAKWLERLVLPGQNVLVDAPHLVGRFPSLAAVADLSKTTNLGPEADTGLHAEKVGGHRVAENVWVSRPVWLWPTLSENKDIEEVRSPFSMVDTPVFFTEDSSVFRSKDWCRPFAADVEPFSRRYVTREASAGESDKPPYVGPYGLGRVSYQPQLRFAL